MSEARDMAAMVGDAIGGGSGRAMLDAAQVAAIMRDLADRDRAQVWAPLALPHDDTPPRRAERMLRIGRNRSRLETLLWAWEVVDGGGDASGLEDYLRRNWGVRGPMPRGRNERLRCVESTCPVGMGA